MVNLRRVQFLVFLRTIDAKFETYDMEGTLTSPSAQLLFTI